MEKDNENRRNVLSVIDSEPMTISKLARRLKLSRPTIYLHVDKLKKKGLVGTKKEPKKKGSPVTVFVKDKEVSKYKDERVLNLLRKVKEIGDVDIFDFFNKSGIKISENSYLDASLRGLISKRIYLTEKGKQLLKQNEKKTS